MAIDMSSLGIGLACGVGAGLVVGTSQTREQFRKKLVEFTRSGELSVRDKGGNDVAPESFLDMLLPDKKRKQ
jgi:hypothetical protein